MRELFYEERRSSPIVNNWKRHFDLTAWQRYPPFEQLEPGHFWIHVPLQITCLFKHVTWTRHCVWLAERHNISTIQWWEIYFKYEPSKGSKSQKRERGRCRLLVMSSGPDDGALVMKWKKANEARRTKLSLMILYPESSKECFFLNLFFQSLWSHSTKSKNSRHAC